jgi:hypothetical protein
MAGPVLGLLSNGLREADTEDEDELVDADKDEADAEADVEGTNRSWKIVRPDCENAE